MKRETKQSCCKLQRKQLKKLTVVSFCAFKIVGMVASFVPVADT
jgi:hypothetical protein